MTFTQFKGMCLQKYRGYVTRGNMGSSVETKCSIHHAQCLKRNCPRFNRLKVGRPNSG
jgi:hypothetical protein